MGVTILIFVVELQEVSTKCIFSDFWEKTGASFKMTCNNNNNNNDNNDLLIDPLGGSSLLNYINYNYKINQIKLFTNYAVEAGLSESNYSKTD